MFKSVHHQDRSIYDAIIVGVGAVGSATARHLSTQGQDVLAVDRYNIPNSMGSSHGVSRIIRLAYHEGGAYIPLLKQAYNDWENLDAETESNLFTVTGSLSVGKRGSRTFDGAYKACQENELEYEVLSNKELSERFPAWSIEDEYEAVYQPDGGFLDAEQCVVANVEKAIEAGADIRGREAVVEWDSIDDRINVETTQGSYEAENLIITSGPWAGEHIPILKNVLTIERHVFGRYTTTNSDEFHPSRFPVFVADWDGGHFYGLPRHRYPGVKVGCTDDGIEEVDPSTMDRNPSRKEGEQAKSFVKEAFNQSSVSTVALNACPLTHTPDSDFIIDTLPDDPNIIVGTGLSGHGFKMSNAIGHVLADLSIRRSTDLNINRFSLERFQ